jgi:hypothetical protein
LGFDFSLIDVFIDAPFGENQPVWLRARSEVALRR